MQKTILVVLFSLFSLFGIAQNESRLAFEYFKNKEYNKAAELYEKLYNKNHSRSYYTYYLRSLIALNEFDAAEKVVKKQIRRSPKELVFKIDLGYVYSESHESEKASKQYNEAIKKLPKNKMVIDQVANAFAGYREYEWAEKTYLAGRKIVMDEFHYQLANLFAIQRKYDKMIAEYLQILSEDFSTLETVQNRMQYYVTNDFNNEFGDMLRVSLLKKIQEDPDNFLFSEMLIWYYLQKKSFAQAIMQAKSLDKRFNENGKRIIDLAEIVFENQQEDLAYKAYSYVESKGERYPFYFNAILGKLSVLYAKIIQKKITSPEEINSVERQYSDAINTFGNQGLYKNNFKLYKDLAHLQAFYLNKPLPAIDLLKHVSEMRDLPSVYIGSALIEMADIFLLIDDDAQATLTYAKAEGMNKSNSVGDMAKFKKAKLAFYVGDFEWAEAQLDVLKASTSKLIANDAFELAQRIKENYTDSSQLIPMQQYARAELLSAQNKQTEAITLLDSLEKQAKGSSLSDDILFKKAQINEHTANYKEAAKLYEQVYTLYSYDLLADNALYKHAQLCDYKLNCKQKAMELYKNIMVQYSGSVFIVDARERFRALRENKTEQ